jgi:hypothetical protein
MTATTEAPSNLTIQRLLSPHERRKQLNTLTQGKLQLHEAYRLGNFADAEELHKQGALRYETDAKGLSALDHLLNFMHQQLTILLRLNAIAQLNILLQKINETLSKIFHMDHYSAVALQSKNHNEVDLLHLACHQNNLPLAKAILAGKTRQQRSELLNNLHNNTTPLHIACANSSTSLASYLLEQGADPDIQSRGNFQQKTAKQIACKNRTWHLIKPTPWQSVCHFFVAPRVPTATPQIAIANRPLQTQTRSNDRRYHPETPTIFQRVYRFFFEKKKAQPTPFNTKSNNERRQPAQLVAQQQSYDEIMSCAL